jgi:hypothetical protein
MHRWEQFENLVATIHKVINAADYDIETDRTIEEPSGARHQIDVLLRPKTAFAGPILVSCKAWVDPVGIDHVREWSDIVQHTGAAAGVIVAQSGFTSIAIDAARNAERRLSLWQPRPLTLEDFAPDENARSGYIARVETRAIITEPRFVEGSLRLDAVRADGKTEGRELEFAFSFAHRSQWYLRDERDNVFENLWDVFVARAESARLSGVVEIASLGTRFLVLDGVRLIFRKMTFEIDLRKHEFTIEVDLLKRAIGYQNVVTGKLSIVPLSRIEGAHLLLGAASPSSDGA